MWIVLSNDLTVWIILYIRHHDYVRPLKLKSFLYYEFG